MLIQILSEERMEEREKEEEEEEKWGLGGGGGPGTVRLPPESMVA